MTVIGSTRSRLSRPRFKSSKLTRRTSSENIAKAVVTSKLLSLQKGEAVSSTIQIIRVNRCWSNRNSSRMEVVIGPWYKHNHRPRIQTQTQTRCSRWRRDSNVELLYRQILIRPSLFKNNRLPISGLIRKSFAFKQPLPNRLIIIRIHRQMRRTR